MVGNFPDCYPVLYVALFPLLGITLRNNIMHRFNVVADEHGAVPLPKQIGFSFLASVPPIVIAFLTHNVQVISSVTGAYAGTGLMLICPTLLVMAARQQVAEKIGGNVDNPLRSPFQHAYWCYFVSICAVLCVVATTINLVDRFF